MKPIAVDEEKIKAYIPTIQLHEKYPGYEKIFLVLGRVEPVKNIAWLIDVFADVVKQKSNYVLLIVGSGSEEDTIRSQVTRYRLQENVKFEGWTNDPWSYLKTADCLLFPSLSEGYGLVVMEAIAAGTPVIMNNVGVAGYEMHGSDTVRIATVTQRYDWITRISHVYYELNKL